MTVEKSTELCGSTVQQDQLLAEELKQETGDENPSGASSTMRGIS